jgi:hypothetical protein
MRVQQLEDAHLITAALCRLFVARSDRPEGIQSGCWTGRGFIRNRRFSGKEFILNP